MNEKYFIIVQFLQELNDNNSKLWMDANRARYLDCKQTWIKLVDELIHHVYSMDPSIGYLDPKDALFRINRDIRFSHNKMPYNTHFSMLIGRGGRKTHYASYYMQLNHEGKIFIGGGLFQPEPEHLTNVRNYIEHGANGSKLKKIINQTNVVNYYGPINPEYRYKRAPRGYEKAKNADLMLFKSFVLSNTFELSKDNQVTNEIKTRFEILKPFLDYMNKGLVFVV